MRVIAFTGLPGSGKSEAIEAVRRRAVPVVRMGHFVLEEVERRGLPVSEEAIGPVATGMRAEHGDDVWARRTIEALRTGAVDGVTQATPLVAVDGVRSLAEVHRFKQDLGPDFTLVAVTAPDATRHERILGRGRSDDADDRSLVIQRDERERGWGIEAAMAQADHEVHNDAGKEDFHRQIASLLDTLVG